jgi:phospholipid/cholesterol/gamma-HCH transport system permease protein
MNDDQPFSGNLQIWLERLLAAFFLGGQVFLHILQGRVHRRNTLEQMSVVGPASTTIALVTAGFVGMVFTIQVAREFIYFGATTTVGGVLALALARELAPVLTAVVVAGRVGCLCGRNWYHAGNRTNRRALYAQNRSD